MWEILSILSENHLVIVMASTTTRSAGQDSLTLCEKRSAKSAVICVPPIVVAAFPPDTSLLRFHFVGLAAVKSEQHGLTAG